MADIDKLFDIDISSGLGLWDETINTFYSKVMDLDVVVGGLLQRGVNFCGATTATRTGMIEYITINSAGNAAQFGDISGSKVARWCGGMSNGGNDRGLMGWTDDSNWIEYITISTTGDGVDFGNTFVANKGYAQGTSNGSNERGVTMGGYTGSYKVDIDYINISTLSNALDFGDWRTATFAMGQTSNYTNERAIGFGGVAGGSYITQIDYITINSTGNSQNFDDLLTTLGGCCGLSNGTNERGVCCGGYDGGNRVKTMEYITINSAATAIDFGDLLDERYGPMPCSNNTDERGVIMGGQDNVPAYVETIDYITINSPATATDFGDLYNNVARGTGGGFSNSGA